MNHKAFENYFSNSLNVSITENIGEVKVLDENMKPLKKVYVKCFSKNSSEVVSFYKDGYTDLRGRFNYVSLNTDNLSSITKFSILIMDDNFGSLIKESNPPPNISKGPSSGVSNFESFQNYKHEVKEKWRSVNKKK